MTPDQQQHMLDVLDNFAELMPVKYEKGQLEHSDNLWEKDPRIIAREVKDEAIDQFVYIYTLIRWIDRLVLTVDKQKEEIKELRDELNKSVSN